MSLKELSDITEKLTRRLENIPTYQSCEHSEVPNGRVWCNYYNQTFAGRCNHSCPGYTNKYFINKKR